MDIAVLAHKPYPRILNPLLDLGVLASRLVGHHNFLNRRHHWPTLKGPRKYIYGIVKFLGSINHNPLSIPKQPENFQHLPPLYITTRRPRGAKISFF